MSEISSEIWEKQIENQVALHQSQLYDWETARAFYRAGIEAKRKAPDTQLADFTEDSKFAATQIKKCEALLERWTRLATAPIDDLSLDVKRSIARGALEAWQVRQKIAEINYPVLKRLDDPGAALARQESLKAAWMIPLFEGEIRHLEELIAKAVKPEGAEDNEPDLSSDTPSARPGAARPVVENGR